MPTQTANVGLTDLVQGDLNWHLLVNASINLLDGMAALGSICARINEYPVSTSLSLHVSAGSYRKSDGTVGTYAGTVVTMTASLTNYVYLDAAGTLQVNTTGFPSTNCLPIATVVAGASTLTTVTDSRIMLGQSGTGAGYITYATGGQLADGSNIVLGTAGGSQIGTATNQMLGFYGATPVSQPTSANQAALGGIYPTLPTWTTISATNTTDQSSGINSNFSALTSYLTSLVGVLGAIETLANALRSAAVSQGLIKGS